MKIKFINVILISLILTGCSTIVGIKPRESIPPKESTTVDYVEEMTEEETSSVVSGEGLVDDGNKKSLGDISIDGENDSSLKFGQLVAPTRPTEATTTTEEYTTQEYTTQAVAALETTTQSYTEPTTTARDWGDTPNMYSSSFGAPKYKTNVEVPDKEHLKKDSYGNYIIPYEMYSYSQQLPLNERGKIPYVFWYDEFGNILNPFPDELEKYKDRYELGVYKGDDKLNHLLPTVPVQ